MERGQSTYHLRGKRRFGGNKNARKINSSSRFRLGGLNGSDGARSITRIRPLVFIARHVADDILHSSSKAA